MVYIREFHPSIYTRIEGVGRFGDHIVAKEQVIVLRKIDQGLREDVTNVTTEWIDEALARDAPRNNFEYILRKIGTDCSLADDLELRKKYQEMIPMLTYGDVAGTFIQVTYGSLPLGIIERHKDDQLISDANWFDLALRYFSQYENWGEEGKMHVVDDLSQSEFKNLASSGIESDKYALLDELPNNEIINVLFNHLMREDLDRLMDVSNLWLAQRVAISTQLFDQYLGRPKLRRI